jgi:hypothetical protein
VQSGEVSLQFCSIVKYKYVNESDDTLDYQYSNHVANDNQIRLRVQLILVVNLFYMQTQVVLNCQLNPGLARLKFQTRAHAKRPTVFELPRVRNG